MAKRKLNRQRGVKPPEQVTADKLSLEVQAVQRRLVALVKRCAQPGGTVPCTFHVRFDLKFKVETEARRDAIVQAFVEGMSGQPGVAARVVPDEEVSGGD